MDSMTQEEKDDPLLLKSSRIRRIARGSGCRKEGQGTHYSMEQEQEDDAGFRGDRKMRRQMQSMMGFDEELDLGDLLERWFAIIGHRAPSEGTLNLNDLPGSGGRMDVLVRAVNAALFVSHGIRMIAM